MTTIQDNVTEECCPKFDSEKWDNKTFNWKNKLFIKASIPEFFHIPYPPMIGKKITKMMKLAEDTHKLSEDIEDVLLLFNDPHPFRADMYLSVTGQVPNAKNVQFSGTFITKVFDGPFKDIPKYMKQMKDILKTDNKEVEDFYVHYAYCPKCAEKFGHNYMVFFAKIIK
jgi:hypothetical protein